MNTKALEFHGTPGGFFVTYIVTLLSMYVPVFGWAFGFNYVATWYLDNSLVTGKKVKYEAGFGETLKFLFVNILLCAITFGIYIFWFSPKMYSYIADHTTFVDQTAPVPATAPPAVAPVDPATPPPAATV